MEQTRTSLLTVVAIFLSSIPALSQDIQPPTPPLDIPRFYIDALSFASDQPNVSRLDVYIEVPYETLHFTKEGETFRASYEITLDVSDSSDNLVDDKLWTEQAEVKEYEKSVSPQSSTVSYRSFSFAPGLYSLTIQIRDLDTKKTMRIQRKVSVPVISNVSFSMSDIMLVSKMKQEARKKMIYPNISGKVGDAEKEFFLFVETYNQIPAESAMVLLNVLDLKGNVVRHDSSIHPLALGKNSYFLTVNNQELAAGDYVVHVNASPLVSKSDSTLNRPTATASHSFSVRWHGIPVSITDLDIAIDQLQYLLDKDKLDEIKNLPKEEKGARFRDFWKKRDPTSTTERNELMEEYYGRVDYATKHFSHYIEGWKTDMGMVYIIFGPPSNIDRHPFDSDAKPYEVWTYYEQSREFVFVDATGFGDYRLQTPIWDVWRTRPR